MYKNQRFGNAKKESPESHWRNTKYKKKDVGYVCTRITDLEMQKRVT